MHDILLRRARLKKNHFGKGRNEGKIVRADGAGADTYLVIQRDDGTKFECVRHEVTVLKGPVLDTDRPQILGFTHRLTTTHTTNHGDVAQ